MHVRVCVDLLTECVGVSEGLNFKCSGDMLRSQSISYALRD